MAENNNGSNKKINNNSAADTGYNRRNVNNIKRMIIMVLLIMFVLPILFCLFLMVRMNKLEDKIDDLTKMISAGKEDNSVAADAMENEYESPADLQYLDLEAYNDISINTAEESNILSDFGDATATDAIPQEFAEEETYKNGKKVYLTFDDGPGKNTGRLLDILKENNVKATFFVCYNPDESVWPYYSRIVEEGHTLGMHSYSHVYRTIYADKASFIEDVTMIHDFLYEQTGVDVRYYRFPGGSSNTVSNVDIQTLIKFLEDNDIEYYDWNAMSGDAAYDQLSPEELNANILKYVHANEGDSIVLMHDLTDIPETVDGLEDLITTLKEEGYELCPITDRTEPIQHVKYKGNIGSEMSER